MTDAAVPDNKGQAKASLGDLGESAPRSTPPPVDPHLASPLGPAPEGLPWSWSRPAVGSILAWANLTLLAAVLVLLFVLLREIQQAQGALTSVQSDLAGQQAELTGQLDELVRQASVIPDLSRGQEIIAASVDDLGQRMSDLASGQDAGEEVTGVPAALNLQFSCVDAATEQALLGCLVDVQVLSALPVMQFSVQVDEKGPIVLPTRIRVSATAQVQGYKPGVSIFEYLEDGSSQTYSIRLEKP